MNKTDLKHARRYRLTRDVTNPELDRREKYDVQKVPWRKDDVFRARCWEDDYGTGKRMFVQLGGLAVEGNGRRVYHAIGENHEGFKALIDALEELPESATDVVERLNCNVADVLRKLHATGKITTADIEAACAIVQADYDKEET